METLVQVLGLVLAAVALSVLLASAWPLLAAGALLFVAPEVGRLVRRR